jgi:hypothetical protein
MLRNFRRTEALLVELLNHAVLIGGEFSTLTLQTCTTRERESPASAKYRCIRCEKQSSQADVEKTHWDELIADSARDFQDVDAGAANGTPVQMKPTSGLALRDSHFLSSSMWRGSVTSRWKDGGSKSLGSRARVRQEEAEAARAMSTTQIAFALILRSIV